jgi:uncharacterized protein YacL
MKRGKIEHIDFDASVDTSGFQLPKNAGLIVGLIIGALIIASGITLAIIYRIANSTSFYIAVIVMILSPIFLLAAYFVNIKQRQRLRT